MTRRLLRNAMADIHVLRSSDDGTGLHVEAVFHYAVPAGANSAGVSWQTAIIRSRIRPTNTNLPIGDGTGGTITQQERDAISAGAVLEESGVDIPYEPNMSPADVATRVRGVYARLRQRLHTRIHRDLEWYGATMSEA